MIATRPQSLFADPLKPPIQSNCAECRATIHEANDPWPSLDRSNQHKSSRENSAWQRRWWSLDKATLKRQLEYFHVSWRTLWPFFNRQKVVNPSSNSTWQDCLPQDLKNICPTVIQLFFPSQGTDLEHPEKHDLSLYPKIEVHIFHHARFGNIWCIFTLA